MKSVFHNNPGREKYAKQGCLGLIIPYSQYQQRQSAHRRKDPNHYVIYRFLLICEELSGLFGYFNSHIFSSYIRLRGLVRHFSVNQLNRSCCLWCVSEHTPLPGLFSSELVVFFAMLDFAVCPEAFLHKIEKKKNIWLIFHCS